MLLSDTALQDNCLLVYCAVPWETFVLMCMCVITVSSEGDFNRFAITHIVCTK